MRHSDHRLVYIFSFLLILIPAIWLIAFEWKNFADLDMEDIFFEGLYFSMGSLAFFLVMRLKIALLSTGFGIFVIGLEIDFLDEWTHEPDLLSVQIEGLMTTAGLALIAYGIYMAYLRVQATNRELELEIGERQKKEKELRDATEELALLNRILRHDISNDLLVMRGSLDLYKIKSDWQFLEKIQKAINHASKLIEEVRDLEFLIPKTERLREIDISSKIKHAVKRFETEARIEIEIPDGLYVMGDEAISSLLDNILTNAVIHSDRGCPEIRITASLLDNKVQIRFADDGPGIDGDLKEKVFEPGFTTREKGGLGLYIVKRLMERYGGRIWIEDNSPRGSVFVLEFNKLPMN